MREVLFLVATLAIAGCASDNPTPATPNVASSSSTPDANGRTVVCTRETPVGSNIPVKTCGPAMTDAERQQQMQAVENQIRLQQHVAAPGGN